MLRQSGVFFICGLSEYGSFDKAKKDMMVDIACKQYTHDKNAMFIPADLTMNKSYEL